MIYRLGCTYCRRHTKHSVLNDEIDRLQTIECSICGSKLIYKLLKNGASLDIRIWEKLSEEAKTELEG